MKRTRQFLLSLAFIGCIGCAGGGVESNGIGSQSKFASAAPLQFLPYEALKNNIVTGLKLDANSTCIQTIDNEKELFGAQTSGGTRALGFSVTRQKETVRVGDICCREALKKNFASFFDSKDSVNFDKLGRAIFGRPLTAENNQVVTDLLALTGYASSAQKQQAVCVSLFSSFEATLQ